MSGISWNAAVYDIQTCVHVKSIAGICFLSCSHVANASGISWNAGNLDFTGGQMVLTLKLISMAMCFQDANSRNEEVRLGGAGAIVLQLCSAATTAHVT